METTEDGIVAEEVTVGVANNNVAKVDSAIVLADWTDTEMDMVPDAILVTPTRVRVSNLLDPASADEVAGRANSGT